MFTLSFTGQLRHSAKGSTWDEHKYLKKVDGNYYYPVGYTKGRTVDSLKDDKPVEKKKSEIKPKSSSSGVLPGLKGMSISGTGGSKKSESSGKTYEPGVLHIPKELAKTGAASSSLKKTESNKMSDAEVESMALRTIRGEFGNGQVRKDILGDDYQEIQDKVNQLMKEITATQRSFTGTPPEVVEKGETAMKSAIKKVSNTKVTESSKGIDMEQVQSVYRKKRT